MSSEKHIKGIGEDEALALISVTDEEESEALFSRAGAIREAVKGRTLTACSIVNARCGNCQEDCAFCAQSARADTIIDEYELLPEEEIFKAAERAAGNGACHFGIVTSGRNVKPGLELDLICGAVKRIKEQLGIEACASLGCLDQKAFRQLKEAGLTRYHHNLETAESHFSEICGTRDYAEQLRTVRDAEKAGLSICCGGIFGLGETLEQRIELLAALRNLDVDSIPLNFLVPIPGTRMENAERLTPFDCLKIIAVSRLMLPAKTIRVCGGRELNLREMQSRIFDAGADGLMIGGYLVTAGRPVAEDLKMIRNKGFLLKSRF